MSQESSRSQARGGTTFHHVGFVVPSIQAAVERIAHATGSTWDGNIVHDPTQRVRVTFLRDHLAMTPSIELVEPASEDSPVGRFLEKGGGLHHVCYEVDSLEDQLAHCRTAGILPISRPAPAPAFDGRRIVWVFTPEGLLVEYLERGAPHGRGDP